jgi:Gas vesicle protein
MSLPDELAGSRVAQSSPARAGAPRESANLADILERVLDKGIVIAGDIRVNVLDIELLTIKIRLLVASVDKARELGIDWWEHDPALSSGQRRPGGDREIDRLAGENRVLRDRIAELEATAETAPAEERAKDPANEVAE